MRPKHKTDIARRGTQGIPAGLRATVAMSAVLALADAIGLIQEQPPHLIVRKLMPRLSEGASQKSAVVAHFGYGALAGAAYGVLNRPQSSRGGRGVFYGLAVWAAGYEGWLPLLGIIPPAHRDTRSRAVTMFIAHIVYGASLARRFGRSAQ